ncbi:hypothetical protein DSECCO2_591430 [anaerobic digester metagenome]
MEARKNAAGNGDEENRNKFCRVKIITIGKGAGIPVVPYVQQRIALCENADKDADGGEQQDSTENRINSADDLINREYCRDQIVSKNNAVNDPCGGRCRFAVKAEYLNCRNIAGRINKHSAHQNKQ